MCVDDDNNGDGDDTDSLFYSQLRSHSRRLCGQARVFIPEEGQGSASLYSSRFNDIRFIHSFSLRPLGSLSALALSLRFCLR